MKVSGGGGLAERKEQAAGQRGHLMSQKHTSVVLKILMEI